MTVVSAGATSFLQNGGANGDGDGVMIVDTTGAIGVIVDAIAYNGAVAANGITIFGKTVSGSLVEGTPSTRRDSDVSARALCRRHNDTSARFEGAQDTGDHAADVISCEF